MTTKAVLKTTATLLSVISISTVSVGQIMHPSQLKDSSLKAKEYFVGKSLGKPLITVNLINGVASPGVYHVPIDTNFSELLSYAGGAIPIADLSEITIRSKRSAKKFTTYTFNFDSAMEKGKSIPLLKDSDIVHIAKDDTLDKSTKWATIGAAFASILTAIVVISDRD